MPFTMTQQAPGMPPAAYDQLISEMLPHLRSAKGFISHAAVVEGDGMAVTEVWETREDWEAWFEGSVKQHLPPDVPEAKTADVHNAFTA